VRALFVLLLAGLVCYAPSLRGGFVWDDTFLVEHNPFIRSPILSFEAFRHCLDFNFSSNFYRPVQTLSYIMDYWFWALQPLGYRITNLLLHVLCGWLLYLLLRRLLPALSSSTPATPATGDRSADTAALVLALLWVIHPVHSATVAYISGRADSLAVCFALLAWLSFESATNCSRRASQILHYSLAFIAGLAALCSKEMGSIWLAFFAARLAFLPLGNSISGQWPRKALAFAGGALVLLAYLALRGSVHTPPRLPGPPPEAFATRLVLMGRALGDYASLLLAPIHLFMERQVFPAYDPALRNATPFFPYHALFLGGLLFAAALGCGAWQRAPGRALRVAGAGWFLVGFLPISNLVPLNASVAEHWLYVPSIGFLLFALGCWQALPATRQPVVATACLSLAVPLLMLRTNLRSADWLDQKTFVQQTIEAGGRSPRQRLMYGGILLRRGQYAAAETVERDLARDCPKLTAAQIQLALNLSLQGRYEESEGLLRDVLAKRNFDDPRMVLAATRALAQLPTGSDAESRARREADRAQLAVELDAALRRTPDRWDLINMKAQQLAEHGDLTGAIQLTTDYAQTHWWHYDSHLLLGELSYDNGRPDAALACYEDASRLDVHEATTWPRRAALHLLRGEPALAYDVQQVALRRAPADPANHRLLALILNQLGRTEEANGETAQANRLQAASAAVGAAMVD